MKFVRCGDICIEMSEIVYAQCDSYPHHTNKEYVIELYLKDNSDVSMLCAGFKEKKNRDLAFDKLCETLQDSTKE